MKRAVFVLFLLLTSAPLFAAWYPVFNPRSISMAVGETRYVEVHAQWSGISFMGPIAWTFRVMDSDIATGEASVTTSKSVEFPIVGVGPGDTGLFQVGNYGFVGNGFVAIHVFCATEPPVLAAPPVLESWLGDEVTLRAASSIADRSRFRWYAGEINDVSRLIPLEGTELTFVPETPGTHHYWVMATTPCSTSSAAFTVIVHPPKRRAVR